MEVKYWYKTTIISCPVCGKEKAYKERQYTEKPEDCNERVVWCDRYDWCEG